MKEGDICLPERYVSILTRGIVTADFDDTFRKVNITVYGAFSLNCLLRYNILAF